MRRLPNLFCALLCLRKFLRMNAARGERSRRSTKTLNRANRTPRMIILLQIQPPRHGRADELEQCEHVQQLRVPQTGTRWMLTETSCRKTGTVCTLLALEASDYVQARQAARRRRQIVNLGCPLLLRNRHRSSFSLRPMIHSHKTQ